MAGSAGRPTRRATDSSYERRAHPDRGERTAPNKRLKLTGAAILGFRASAFLQAAPSQSLPQPAAGFEFVKQSGRQDTVRTFSRRDSGLGGRALEMAGRRKIHLLKRMPRGVA